MLLDMPRVDDIRPGGPIGSWFPSEYVIAAPDVPEYEWGWSDVWGADSIKEQNDLKTAGGARCRCPTRRAATCSQLVGWPREPTKSRRIDLLVSSLVCW